MDDKVSKTKISTKVVKKNSVAYIKQKEKAKARKRKYLDNMTTEQREIKRAKDREYYRKKKAEKKTKPIADMTEREKRMQRMMWRKNSKKYRQKKKSLETTLNITPPDSDSENIPVATPSSSHKKAGRKVVRKDRAKAYRNLQKKNEQITRLQQTVDRLRKKLERQNNSLQITSSASTNNVDMTPNTKVNALIKDCNVPPEVRKKLLFSEVISTQLEQTSQNLPKNSKEKEAFQKCVSGDILKKYRLQHMAAKFLPKKSKDCKQILISDRKKPIIVVTHSIQQKLTDFYEKDDVSRMCPGKKDFTIKGKLKKQKRVLLDTLSNLHSKFIEESGIQISYSTFLRQKPFWVVVPTWRDRETCLCVRHENFGFMISKLNSLKQITTKTTAELIKQYSCDIRSYDCMFGYCLMCKNIEIDPGDNNDTVNYSQWQTQNENRTIKGEMKVVRISKKVLISSTVRKLKITLAESIPDMKKHLYGIYSNNKDKIQTKENLKSNEIMMQIDFSENYVTKYGHEIQSTHFGASKGQLSIHTGVYYTKDENDNTTQTHSFATVSDNLDHQAHAVWAHVKHILRKILMNKPLVDTLYMFSDGPTSQYRNRKNIHLWLKTLLEDTQISTATWTFSEPGHGKGPMDGIGGVLKRTADKQVLMGKDVTTAKDFVNLFTSSSVQVYEISSCDIESMKILIPDDVDAIPGIMNITKITWKREMGCVIKLFQNEKFQKEVKLKSLIADQREPCFMSVASNEYLEDYENVLSELLEPTTSLRTRIYKTVYGSSSSDDEDLQTISARLQDERNNINSEAGTSIPLDLEKENVHPNLIHPGTFLLIDVPTQNKNKYRYVAMADTIVEEDGEVKVTFLKSQGSDAKMFAVDLRDVSYVSYDEIVKILPEPEIKMKGSRQYYFFRDDVEIFEK